MFNNSIKISYVRIGLIIGIALTTLISCDMDDGGFNFGPYELVDTGDSVIAPPKGFDPFYKKYINADGIAVTGSAQVRDEALVRVRQTIIHMLAKRPDVLKSMMDRYARVGIIAAEEETSDLPEYRHVDDPVAFSNRGRGYGGTPSEPFASCAEENVMRDSNLTNKDKMERADGWHGQDIFVHEFAHSIHLIGFADVPELQKELTACYQNAKSKGLWKNTYAISNMEEYFAELTQSWWDCNMESYPADNRDGDGTYNGVNTRAELRTYDPMAYALMQKVYDEDDPWRPEPFIMID